MNGVPRTLTLGSATSGLPLPEPSPRPTRLRGLVDPGGGFKLLNSFAMTGSFTTLRVQLLDINEMDDFLTIPRIAGVLSRIRS